MFRRGSERALGGFLVSRVSSYARWLGAFVLERMGDGVLRVGRQGRVAGGCQSERQAKELGHAGEGERDGAVAYY